MADATRSADVKNVPLHGKIAAGRVALVDDADYDLVMQYRWHAAETGRTTYARTKPAGSKGLFMHTLITGLPEVDHRDRDGLNNQRDNLREATRSQNAANRGKRSDAESSRYKGVNQAREGRWRAVIGSGGQTTRLGYFSSELGAAYAYDEAARELFGPFACTNFDEPASQEMKDQWRAQDAAHVSGVGSAHSAFMSDWWKGREPETRTCVVCGEQYQSRAKRSFYCGTTCRSRYYATRRRPAG